MVHALQSGSHNSQEVKISNRRSVSLISSFIQCHLFDLMDPQACWMSLARRRRLVIHRGHFQRLKQKEILFYLRARPTRETK
jgi:hypothetical protein